MVKGSFAIEVLSQDFKKFLNFKPQIDDKYTKAYKFLRDNEGLEFTKTQLLQIFTSQLGFSREPLRHNFSGNLSLIADIADLDDYIIIYDSNEYKHGTVYSLVRKEYMIDRNFSNKGVIDLSISYPYCL